MLGLRKAEDERIEDSKKWISDRTGLRKSISSSDIAEVALSNGSEDIFTIGRIFTPSIVSRVTTRVLLADPVCMSSIRPNCHLVLANVSSLTSTSWSITMAGLGPIYLGGY